jgi:ribosome-binding factor A
MKQPSQRQLRVNEQIRGVVSQTLHQGHFRDEVLFKYAADVTVGAVDASPDLKNATVFVMSLGMIWM